MTRSGERRGRRLSLVHLNQHPEKRDRFKFVRIWSGQWQAWWREGGHGYCVHARDAGVFTMQDAWDSSAHCGPEKRISYVEAEAP